MTRCKRHKLKIPGTLANTGVILIEVVYFFAVFSVHYVREFFKDDTLTADLFKNMGEAMFTLSGALIVKEAALWL